MVCAGRESKAAGELVVVIDTSGSISAELLTMFLDTVEEFLNEEVKPRVLHLVSADYRVRETYELREGDILKKIKKWRRNSLCSCLRMGKRKMFLTATVWCTSPTEPRMISKIFMSQTFQSSGYLGGDKPMAIPSGSSEDQSSPCKLPTYLVTETSPSSEGVTLTVLDTKMLVLAGIIVWLFLITIILKFFAASSEVKECRTTT